MADDPQRVYRERFATTFALHRAGVALMRQSIRRRLPEACEEEVEARWRAWLQQHPEAPFGDCLGAHEGADG